MMIKPGDIFPDVFPKGAVLLVDKPFSWTSFDVVNKVRYALGNRLQNKKLKVGHAGTLDPLATGLLVICVGDFTRRIDEFVAEEKEYTGTISFGGSTASYDLEKAVDTFFPVDHITDELVQETRLRFVGDIQQIPPIYSAVKVDGQRLYINARTGEAVERPERTVNVSVFELGPLHPVQQVREKAEVMSNKGAQIWWHPEHAGALQCDFRVVCSKGTYIRTLMHDMGEALGSGAYLSSLRRTRSGKFSVEDAWVLEDFSQWCRKPAEV